MRRATLFSWTEPLEAVEPAQQGRGPAVVVAEIPRTIAVVEEPKADSLSANPLDDEPPKPELPRYETLILQIQNRKGHGVSREDRELACQELIEMFRYLIMKRSSQTWRKESGERRDDWHLDTMSKFIVLVIGDYTPKLFGGSTVFGTYIQSKLYWKMVYEGQKHLKHHTVHKSTDSFHSDGSYDENDRQYFQSDLNSTILELSTGIEEEVIANLRDQEVEAQLREVEKIAIDVLDSRELFLWKSFGNSLLLKKLGSNAKHPYPHHASTN